MSLMSSIRPMKRKTQSLASAVNFDNDPERRKAILQQRLKNFQAKGWLSEQEHRKFSTFLSTFDNTSKIGENGEYALKELEVELNLMEKRIQKSPKGGMFKRILTPTRAAGKRGSPSFSVFKNKSPLGFSKSPKGQQSRPLSNLSNNNTKRSSNGGGTTPVHRGTVVPPASLSTTLSDDDIATLFAETCFFSRLGFVQPPCCMHCTYREAMQQAAPRLDCKRWVIWRRNANIALNPSNISENTIAVQCHTARKMIAGNVVESYKWDRTKKIMVETSKKRAWS
ncbi:MAG: hypothetical protein SGARI_003108 [Bacillariaceae sp.]